MGVHGLWGLLQPTGKPVALESLENKVLAVDISLWLNQSIKGLRDQQDSSLPNAHLLSLFHRICKLMYYRIKPVFVFDGGVPALKRQTIEARQHRRSKAKGGISRVNERLLLNHIKKAVVNKALKNPEAPRQGTSNRRCERDMFELPPMEKVMDDSSESDGETGRILSHFDRVDLHTVDFTGKQFCLLPTNLQHDILQELRETRKQNSWSKIHQMPQESPNFSSFQMERLRKRVSLQQRIETVQKQIGEENAMELEMYGGVVASEKRLVSDETKRYVLVKGLLDKKLQETPKANPSETTVLSEESSEDSDRELLPGNADNVKNFMFENSGLSQEQIMHIIKIQTSPKKNVQAKTEDTFDQPSTSGCSSRSNVSSAVENIAEWGNDIELDQYSSDEDDENDGISQEQIMKIINQSHQEMPSDLSHIHSESEAAVSDMDHLSGANIARNFMFENSGLSQEQILNIIQKQSHTRKPILHRSTDVSSPVLHSSDVVLEHVPKPDSKDHMDMSVGLAKKSDDDIFNDIFTSTPAPENPEPSASELLKSAAVSQTVPLKNESLEIVIDTSEAPKDDIFSDIFHHSSTSDNFTEKIEVMSSSDSEQEFCSKAAVENITVSNQRNKELQLEKTSVAPNPTSSDAKYLQEHPNVKQHLSHTSVNDAEVTEKDMGKPCDSHNHHVQIFVPVTSELSIQVEQTENGKEHTDAEKECIDLDDTEQSSNTVTETPNLKDNDDSNVHNIELLKHIDAELQTEEKNLQVAKRKQERLAATITDQMYLESQELLQLFGIPYIIAPMEAEAQCAYLDSINLTHGSITDDSDIWLFGGKRVYKHFFNQSHHTMFYKSEDILKLFKLTREQLVLLALLVGSDYTEGIESVGPVTALEILAEFPGEGLESLRLFRSWWDMAQVRAQQSTETKVKQKLRKLVLHDSFPSDAVVHAYMDPTVDDSKEKFSWAAPKVELLVDFALEKFGWSKKKSEEILLPVLRRFNDKQTQLKLDAFFSITMPKKSPEKLSQRVRAALKRASGATNSEQARKRVRTTNTTSTSASSSASIEPSTSRQRARQSSQPSEVIMQLEVDKLRNQVNKLKAIEVFRKTKIDPKKKGGMRKPKRIEKKYAELSEESNSD